MVDRIGKSGELAREAIRAALDAQQRISEARPAGTAATPAPVQAATDAAPSVDFGAALEQSVTEIDERFRAAERLPEDLLTGKVSDFHEIAVQLKNAELSFRFALEIRNKLIDAYREIMRMSV
jgi:flagellar hook-basal body complex protein FliE